MQDISAMFSALNDNCSKQYCGMWFDIYVKITDLSCHFYLSTFALSCM